MRCSRLFLHEILLDLADTSCSFREYATLGVL